VDGGLALLVEELRVRLGGREVIGGVSFALRRGETLAVMGPNGVGKSTLLRAIHGIIPYEGRVEARGPTSMIPQTDMLLPWMTIERNIALPLLARGVPERDALERARAVAERLGLAEYLDYYPRQVSGGTRRKASIARALAVNASILLLDEPYTGLDINAVMELQRILAEIKGDGSTLVVVSHQIGEVAEVADKALILRGRPARVAWMADLRGLRYEEKVAVLREAVRRALRPLDHAS